jgi:hypothetical protein
MDVVASWLIGVPPQDLNVMPGLIGIGTVD